MVLSANSNSLMHPFLLVCLLFLCYFISPTRTWIPILNESDKIVHHFHLPEFRRQDFSFPSLHIMLVVGLLYMECIPSYCHGVLKCIPSTPNLLSVSVIKHLDIVKNIVNAFLHLRKDSLSFNLLVLLNHPCIPGINPVWYQWVVLLKYCGMKLADILLRTFSSLSIKDLRLLGYSFLVKSFLPLVSD